MQDVGGRQHWGGRLTLLHLSHLSSSGLCAKTRGHGVQTRGEIITRGQEGHERPGQGENKGSKLLRQDFLVAKLRRRTREGVFSAKICPAEFPGTGESRAVPNHPEVSSATLAGRTPQERTLPFLSPKEDALRETS